MIKNTPANMARPLEDYEIKAVIAYAKFYEIPVSKVSRAKFMKSKIRAKSAMSLSKKRTERIGGWNAILKQIVAENGEANPPVTKAMLQEVVDACKYLKDENGNPKQLHLLTKRQFFGTPCSDKLTQHKIGLAGGWTAIKRMVAGAFVVESEDACKSYVVTYAQSATPINKPFWQALRTYADHNNSKLIVIPGRYKVTKGGFGYDDDAWYDPDIVQHLIFKEEELHHNLRVFPINIIPTAAEPLSGIMGVDSHSAIVGHPKQHKQTHVSMTTYRRQFLSTGSITSENYSNTAAGAKGKTHHKLGALVVNISDDGIFFAHHVTAVGDGSFIHLDKEYSHKGVTKAPPALGLIHGDAHAEKIDHTAKRATFDQIKGLAPQFVAGHDVIDFTSQNHHARKNLFHRYKNHKSGRTVADDLRDVEFFVDEIAEVCPGEYVIVRSNHDEAIERWAREVRVEDDIVNAKMLSKAKWLAFDMIDSGKPVNLLKELIDVRDNVRFLKRGESLMVGEYECGEHGDIGVNGSRGSINQFGAIGKKMVTGHSHSPARKNSALSVGLIGKLAQGYNHVHLSRWAHSNVVIYANGTATHLDIVDGRWHA